MTKRIRQLTNLINKPLRKNSKGVALLQVLFLVMLITFIVNQVNFEATVEYTVNSQALHRVKAYQAAKAGVELSLLRISLYNRAMHDFGKELGDSSQMLNMIYSLPISWPMQLPTEASSFDQDALKKINKDSLMDVTYSTYIQSEDLLNINDLDSPVEGQRTRIKTQLEDLFKGRLENDQEWADRNQGIHYEEIINNIKDWIDPDTQSENGGDERAIYGKIRELDPTNKDNFPPNRYFRTIDEIRMVPGVTDDVFDLISPAFSVFGPMGINPNLADEGALKAIHKSITKDIVQKIISRRNNPNEGGPFANAEDFFNYVNREGARVNPDEQEKIPLRFSNPCNFRIQSTGGSGKTVVTIMAITYDISCAQAEVSSSLSKQKDAGGDGGGTSKDSTKDRSSSQQGLPKGPPRIVYWNEK